MDSMKKKLFGYMLLLALLLLLAAVMGLFLLGRFPDPRRETARMLALQMSVYEKEVSAQAENAAAMGIRMSEDLSAVLSASLEKQNIAFSGLNDSGASIQAVQDALFDPLRQFLLESGCSGAFVLLDATVNSAVENADRSRTGLYLELGGNSFSDHVLLFRGISETGKAHGVLPHRKWRLEFRTDYFPACDEFLGSAGLSPEKSFRISSLLTLPGTSEKAVLLLLPLQDAGGKCLGICGFEISENLFKQKYGQASVFPHLTCLLDPAETDSIRADAVLSCGLLDGYYDAPSDDLSVTPFAGGLSLFSGESTSYIGIRRSVSLAPGGKNSALAVMIPKTDYDRTVRENNFTVILLFLLLAFFAVTISLSFSRRFLSPILKSISDMKMQQAAASAEAAKIRQDFERLAPRVRDEIDEDSFAIFRENMEKLTPKEREVFRLTMDGHSSKEITEIEGFSINALKYHYRNLYSKLGVSSKKEMLRYSTLLRRETDGK